MVQAMDSSCNKSFASSYMLLEPEKVGFFDLFKILFSTNLEDRKFVNCPESTVEGSFRRRWLIFLSVLAQLVLKFIAKPLAFLGSIIEMWLNLVVANRTVFRLMYNFIRGKVAMPDRTSAEFLSFIGNLDKRVELDVSIKSKDSGYIAALAMMASKLSYENTAFIKTTVEEHWKMHFIAFGDYWNDYQGKATTQAFILQDKSNKDHDIYFVAFRGTEPFDADAWCLDFDLSWYELYCMGKIHGGFMKALGLQKNVGWPKDLQGGYGHQAFAYYTIRDILRDRLARNPKAKFVLTGHSLGGALAILFPAILFLHDEKNLLKRLEGVYTFGQPRVGDRNFANYMVQKLRDNGIKYHRFVYGNDMVPRLPFDDKDLMFKHFGTCIYFNRRYQAQIVKEEPNKNYLSPWAAIPMMVNALMELIRSFTIVLKYGKEYKEGTLLKIVRIIGLMAPGVPAHCPQDYNNSTRLGTLRSAAVQSHFHA